MPVVQVPDQVSIGELESRLEAALADGRALAAIDMTAPGVVFVDAADVLAKTAATYACAVEAVEGWLCAAVAAPSGERELQPLDTSGLAARLVDQIRSVLEAEIVDEHERGVERVVRARRTHHQQIDALMESTRWRLGDALASAAGSPRRLGLVLRETRSLFRDRGDRGSKARHAAPMLDGDPNRDVRIDSVLDEFSEHCLWPEARFRRVPRSGPSGWVAQVSADPPALLFVESAWSGNGGTWRHSMGAFGTGVSEDLKTMVAYYRDKGIPTVFWNKEDPVGFEAFLDVASLFDRVMTTDADVVDEYRALLDHHRVGVMPFAAQPRLHNPLGCRDDVRPMVCFAGGWRAEKYARRSAALETILDPALELGVLRIFDRHAGEGRLAFPDPYRRVARPGIHYRDMLREYRRYAAFLNVNTIEDSPTMLSRRVFEVLACGTPVISTPARAIDEMLGDVVIVVSNRREAKSAIEEMLADTNRRDQIAQRGLRRVLHEHTYDRRLEAALVDVVDLDRPVAVDPVIVGRAGSVEHVERMLEMRGSQLGVDPQLVVVADVDVCRGASRLVEVEPQATLIAVDARLSAGQRLERAFETLDHCHVCIVDPSVRYGQNYLSDQLLALRWSRAAVVGKRALHARCGAGDTHVVAIEAGHEYSPVDRLHPATLLLRRGTRPWKAEGDEPESSIVADLVARGHEAVATDRFNVVVPSSDAHEGAPARLPLSAAFC